MKYEGNNDLTSSKGGLDCQVEGLKCTRVDSSDSPESTPPLPREGKADDN